MFRNKNGRIVSMILICWKCKKDTEHKVVGNKLICSCGEEVQYMIGTGSASKPANLEKER